MGVILLLLPDGGVMDVVVAAVMLDTLNGMRGESLHCCGNKRNFILYRWIFFCWFEAINLALSRVFFPTVATYTLSSEIGSIKCDTACVLGFYRHWSSSRYVIPVMQFESTMVLAISFSRRLKFPPSVFGHLVLL